MPWVGPCGGWVTLLGCYRAPGALSAGCGPSGSIGEVGGGSGGGLCYMILVEEGHMVKGPLGSDSGVLLEGQRARPPQP